MSVGACIIWYSMCVCVSCVSRDGRVASDRTGKRIRFYGAINTRSSQRNNRISFIVWIHFEDRMMAKNKVSIYAIAPIYAYYMLRIFLFQYDSVQFVF